MNPKKNYEYSDINKNFLLISPTLISEVPLTIAILAGVLKEEGFSVSSIVNTFKKPLLVEDFVRAAKDYKANFVGISMMTFEILFVYKIIDALKKEGFEVIVGGSHPTDLPEECIKAGADIVVRNEGEETLKELCKFWKGDDIELREIRGITFRDNDGNITSTRERTRINLSNVPKLNLDVFDLDLFYQENGLIKGFNRIYTSRGCPGFCTFCDWQVFKQKMRYYPIPDIIDDIKWRIKKYGITSFTIADDCFTLNKNRVYELCEEINKIQPKIIWQASSRANLITLDMLKRMKESGCFLISFGFESGDSDTLLRIKKHITLEENINAALMAKEAGLRVYGNLMIGFPWETIKHIENDIKFIHKVWKEVSLFQVSGSLIPFPGTQIYHEYADEYEFREYWLESKHQQDGIQIYQNVINPLAVSTFYQRYLFDDTYIQEDTFFTYSKEYKKKVREMIFEIGRHNLPFMFKKQVLHQTFYMNLAKISMMMYEYFPKLEKNIGGTFFRLFNKRNQRTSIEQIRDNRRGFIKNKEDIEI